jgi:hypothetical protein
MIEHSADTMEGTSWWRKVGRLGIFITTLMSTDVSLRPFRESSH